MCQDEIFFQDNNFIVIYDGYPRARHHLLLLPKPSFLDATTPWDLLYEHLPRLRRLHAVGEVVAKHLSHEQSDFRQTSFGSVNVVPVRCGYFALSVMKPLHLHIISQDLDGPWITNPKDWNHFTSGA
ncbi:unnamed protein product [Hapterophycus canaliculatus]